MSSGQWVTNEPVRAMDFAGGVVIHIHWLRLFLFLLLIVGVVVWLVRRKR